MGSNSNKRKSKLSDNVITIHIEDNKAVITDEHYGQTKFSGICKTKNSLKHIFNDFVNNWLDNDDMIEKHSVDRKDIDISDKIGYYIYSKPDNKIYGKDDGKGKKVHSINKSVDTDLQFPDEMFDVREEAYDAMVNIRNSNKSWHKGDVEVYYFDGKESKFAFSENYERSKNMKTKVREFLYQGKKMTSQEAYDDGVFDDILEELGVSEESVKLVVNINGNSLETYNNILYAATGYNDLEQINE